MISSHNLGALMGAPVVGPDNDKIGTVGQIFVDPETGNPNWATVHTGLFGRHESFVPLEDATWDHEILHVPFDKQIVKDAPRIDTDSELSPADELGLYRYYSLPTAQARGDDETSDSTVREQPQSGGATRAAVPRGGASDSPREPSRADTTDVDTAPVTPLEPTREGDTGTTDVEPEQGAGDASTPMRMRKYVIVEEQIPVESDGDSDQRSR
ncbi:MAG: hypothetical protein JWQ59_1205 [Cryobacterium sp.]|jgi:hypothetical protein|nr:hypothetical protein [Cryobacterium sp.]